MHDYKISSRATRVLNVILLGLILILVRVWYLGIIQHEDYLEQARKPQRRTLVEHSERATIRDRFNIPLAINKIQFNASICYAHIREIPSISWKRDEKGKRVRVLARTAYISQLSQALAKELNMDPLVIEDTIHGKASLFPHTPFVIKADISEKEYYRLKILEKEWLGIQAERVSRRFYPQGKIAADVVGYLGAISSKEYLHIAEEIQELQAYLAARESGEFPFLPKGFHNPLEVRARLKQLQEKAYTVNDYIGKSGIEGAFDSQLRGLYGKKTYEIDVKGNFLRELPGSKRSVDGQRLLLTISSELQECAEALLAEHELIVHKEEKNNLSSAWVRGGAIVAMHPETGEILALASYPRYNPNDFIPHPRSKQSPSLVQWLENETYLKEIWEGRRPISRELFSFAKGDFYEETFSLNWERYLEAILPEKSPVLEALHKIHDLKTAFSLQKNMETLLHLSGQKEMRALIQVLYSENGNTPTRLSLSAEQKQELRRTLDKQGETFAAIKKRVDPFFLPIAHNDDKVLLLDLCRLLVNFEGAPPALLQEVGDQSLADFHALCQKTATLQAEIYFPLQELFHDTHFSQWRHDHFKEFLQKKRKEEKAQKKYARPYTDYLDLMEKKMFREFWQDNRLLFLEVCMRKNGAQVFSEHPELKPYISYLLNLQIKDSGTLNEALSHLSPALAKSYLQIMRSFQELSRPLYGHYPHLRKEKGVQLEKHLAAAFYPLSGFGYGRSHAYRQSTPQGSVFKLITAYEALQQKYHNLPENHRSSFTALNPLTLIDDLKRGEKGKLILGFTLDGQPITRNYKGGRLPKSSHANIGKIDLLGALEQSSNIYFSILANEFLRDPNDLAHAARLFGYGEKTGIELPGEIAGSLPTDLGHNLAGLYSFAIGQHSLIATPLQTALMLGAVANGGHVLKPKIIKVKGAQELFQEKKPLFSSTQFPFEEPLSLVGVGFPLFTQIDPQIEEPPVSYATTEIRRSLFFPPSIRSYIFEGMRRAVTGPRGTARASILHNPPEHPHALEDFIDLQNQIVAKTGTAEVFYKHTIDAATPPIIKNHVWFIAISFAQEPGEKKWEKPELAVVVYLRLGKAGKEGALMATQIIKKWREICAKHGCDCYSPTDNNLSNRL